MVNKNDYGLYFLNDLYDDEIVQNTLSSFRTRIYNENLNSGKYSQNIYVKNGVMLDIIIDNDLNSKYDLPPNSYSLHFNCNIIPFYSEKAFIENYGYGNVITSVDIMNDEKVFDRNVFFFIGDYMIYDVKIVIEKQECVIFIPIESTDTASNMCLQQFQSIFNDPADSSWSILMTKKSDFYYTYSTRALLITDNKIYLSKLNTKKIIHKESKENCWTLYLTCNNLSKNIMTATDTTLLSDANGWYFTIPDNFKSYISEKTNAMKCLIVNEPECTGKGIREYSIDTLPIFQIPFKKNPIPVENFIVWKYDTDTSRKKHPIMQSINVSYPNIYDFSEMLKEDYETYLYESTRRMVVTSNDAAFVLADDKTYEVDFDLHVSWMESENYSINHYESYLNDYITFYGDEYPSMRFNNTLHPAVQSYTPITHVPWSFNEYITSEYFGDYRSWILNCMIKLLTDNPMRYDELYHTLYSKNKKFITKTFTYKSSPRVYERSIKDNANHCNNAKERMVYFEEDHSFVQVFNHTCKDKHCMLYINGVRKNITHTMTYGSTMYIYFPSKYISNQEDIQIDIELENDDIDTKLVTFDSIDTEINLSDVNFQNPNSLSNVWMYDYTSEIMLDDDDLDVQLKLLATSVKFNGANIIDTLTCVDDVMVAASSEYNVVDNKVVRFNIEGDALNSHKKINLNNLSIKLSNESLLQKQIAITNTNFYCKYLFTNLYSDAVLFDANLLRIETVDSNYIALIPDDTTVNSGDLVFSANDFKGTRSSLWFRVYYDGKLINPRKCTFLFTNMYNSELQIFIDDLHGDGEIMVEYIGHDEEIIFNDSIKSLKTIGDDIISLDNIISTPFDLYSCRLFIDGYRVPEYCIKIIGQSTMLLLNDFKFDVTDESILVIFKQVNDEDPYEYSTEKAFLSSVCKDDAAFRRYMIDTYKK